MKQEFLNIDKTKSTHVAVCYALLYRFRIPIFQRLSERTRTTLLVGSGVKGGKHAGVTPPSQLTVKILYTLGKTLSVSGRYVPLTFNPSLLFHILKARPDVLLVQGGELPNNIVILIYAKIFRVPIVWWSLGEVEGRVYSRLAKTYRTLVQLVEKQCDVYLGYSSASREYFIRQGYISDRCFSLVNVVDTDLVASRISEDRKNLEQLKETYSIKSKIVITYVGSIVETKGLDRLVSAMTMLGDLDVHLMIVGDGYLRAKIEVQVDSLGLREKISFAGAVYEGVGSYFELSDLLVMPGTGGLVVSEAMTHSVPVICATGDGSEKDLIEQGVNGFVLADDSVTRLADTIRTAISDENILREMGKAAKSAIDDKYNITTYMNTMMAAIELAVSSRK